VELQWPSVRILRTAQFRGKLSKYLFSSHRVPLARNALPDRKLRFAVNILPRSDMEAWSGELQEMVQQWRSVQRWINSHLNIAERFRPH
jgi:hypothetical protein